MKPLKLAIAGLGTVGAGVVRSLTERRAEIGERAGCKFEIVMVSARDQNKKRGCNLEGIPWTADAASLASCDADVIVELIGGPVLVSSANIEDKPGSRSAANVKQKLERTIDVWVDAGDLKESSQSTLVELAPESWSIVREGAVSRAAIEKALG